MVARMVASRDMVPDAERRAVPARDGEELFEGCCCFGAQGGKAGQPLGLGCKCLPYVS